VATRTKNFGAGKREAHDATDFYARFTPPDVAVDDEVPDPRPVAEACVLGDARSMDAVADGTVALVVTSPPYFAGKEYEEALGEGHVPGSYFEYLAMLRDVFAECKRVLEPGGRIAVNVANLGRKPFRSLAADVTRILQDDLGLLLRGEVVWRKGDGASGSCAWGSFRSPANPVLRDTTERVIIASKGRFDRALNARQRAARGLPHESTLTTDEFLEATLDVWDLAPESARRVGHPAPFPVELPQRLIELYTYRDDLVLDPFLGSGSTVVAAARTGRRAIGYETDAEYVAIAQQRLAEELTRAPESPVGAGSAPAAFPALAEHAIRDAGFTIVASAPRPGRLGVAPDVVAADGAGRSWSFLVAGSYSAARGGLTRVDVAQRLLGRAAALHATDRGPVVLLTSHLPRPGSEPDHVLRALGSEVVFDVVELRDHAALERLAQYGTGGVKEPIRGFWRGP
jgi:site-specific DNA-methyltransferase (adenine-specific)